MGKLVDYPVTIFYRIEIRQKGDLLAQVFRLSSCQKHPHAQARFPGAFPCSKQAGLHFSAEGLSQCTSQEDLDGIDRYRIGAAYLHMDSFSYCNGQGFDGLDKCRDPGW